MKQGGTFTFSVLAHNGGGRAGQSDTANVKIEFFNSTGGLITSVNSTNSANLPNPNAVCGNPCIDTTVPWSTVTISATLSSLQASQVVYAKVSMYGIDGSYWAGDYGPWYRAPTLQLNGGGNLLYNPEFGPYNNITAQGWTSSPGFGACQGAWGGSNACIVNSDGVPGSSTVGLVANANGGGPSATGGTTSGQAGGYNNTMTVTNAGTGATAGGPPPPAPTAIYMNNATVRITNIWPTSDNSPNGEGASNAFDNNPNTKYLNFDKLNAGVTVKLNAGRVVNGFTITTANDFSGRDPTSYKLYGSNDGVTWVLIQEGSLSLSNNRLTTSDMINVTNTNAYAYYYIMFPTTKAGTGCGLDCDSMQIAEITYYYDANNTTTSTASGGSSTPVDPVQAASGPTVEGGTITQTNGPNNQTITSGGSSSAGFVGTQQTRVNTWTNLTQQRNNELYIEQTYGTNNQVSITQSGQKNRIDFTMGGNNNIVNNTQTGSNYLKEEIPGWGNNITINQSNVNLTNYAETKIQGNGNTVNHTQTGPGNHILFNTVTGDINTVNTTQTGAAGHYAETKLTGNWNSVTVNQSGNTANKANIDLTNAGGPASLDLQQTGGKNFTIIQSCTNPAGCTTTIRQ
jgi:hypothetical protein